MGKTRGFRLRPCDAQKIMNGIEQTKRLEAQLIVGTQSRQAQAQVEQIALI